MPPRKQKAPPAGPAEWSLKGFLQEFEQIDREVPDRFFAFVLGAGASKTSGIPTGGELVDRWLPEIQKRDPKDSDLPIEEWATEKRLGIEGFRYGARASFYPELYERRFGHDPETGSRHLEALMERAEPSFGYSVLARILDETRHKAVITTNFDNLVADALSIFTDTFPFVAGHESLTDFVRPLTKRPLVAKVHRDLLLSPKNRPEELRQLAAGWERALGALFKRYTPIVVGYGGNDGSLMGFLESLAPASIPGGIFWCYRPDDPPEKRIRALVAKQNGKLVKIEGFDELFLVLNEKLGYDLMDRRISEKAEARVARYDEQFKRLSEKLKAPVSEAQEEERELARSAAGTIRDKRIEEAEARLRENPDDPGTLIDLGNLYMERDDLNRAEALYEKAASAAEAVSERGLQAAALGNLGIVCEKRGQFEEAIRRYERSLEISTAEDALAAVSANQTVNLANVHLFRGDLDRAEEMYGQSKRFAAMAGYTAGTAIAELNLGNVDVARGDLARGDAQWEKAFELYRKLDYPKGRADSLLNLGSNAILRGDLDRAERILKDARFVYLEIGSFKGVADCGKALGHLAICQDELEAAERYLEDALATYEQLGYPVGEAEAASWLGLAQLLGGELEPAAETLDRALARADALGGRWLRAATRSHLGILATRQGDLARAESLFRKSVEVAGQLALVAARGQANLGNVHYLRGDPIAAKSSWSEALARFIASGAGLDRAKADRMLAGAERSFDAADLEAFF